MSCRWMLTKSRWVLKNRRSARSWNCCWRSRTERLRWGRPLCVRSQTRLESLVPGLCSTRSCRCSCLLLSRIKRDIYWSRSSTESSTNWTTWFGLMYTRSVYLAYHFTVPSQAYKLGLHNSSNQNCCLGVLKISKNNSL